MPAPVGVFPLQVAALFSGCAPTELVLPDCTQLDAPAMASLLKECATTKCVPWASGLMWPLMGLMRPLMGLMGPLMGLMGPLMGLMEPLMGPLGPPSSTTRDRTAALHAAGVQVLRRLPPAIPWHALAGGTPLDASALGAWRRRSPQS